MRRSSRGRLLRPSQRSRAAPAPSPPPPAPVKAATPAEVEKALERRTRLQRGLTSEVKRTAVAYREVAGLQGVGIDEMTVRYRDPHDKTSEFDRLDRKDPTVITRAHLALYVPGFIRRMRAVPGRAVGEYGEDDDGEFALIECPCGAKPIARVAIEKCPGCERYYTIFAGKRAIVIYGAMSPPGAGEHDEPPEPRCEYGTCDGEGLVIDELTNTAYDCLCRSDLIAARRAARS